MDSTLPTKVLILSQDARVREPAAEVLLRTGFVVDQASDTAEALASAGGQRPPDIVLLDATEGESGEIARFLDQIGERFAAKTVLLASFRTPMPLREHPSVVYVLDAPAAVASLLSLADWIGECDPHSRPSLVLRPLSRIASRKPADRHAS